MTIFDDQNEEIIQIDPNKDYLAELTGPGGKFDKAKFGGSELEAYKAMARGKAEADRMITVKNREFDQLREDYLKAKANADAQAKFEDLLTRLESKSGNDNNNSGSTQNNGNVEQPVLDEAKLDTLIEQRVLDIENRKREKANLDAVENKLRERFGDNAQAILRDKMNTLGITNEDIKFLAKKSPEAVFNALGLNSQPPAQQEAGLPRSSFRTDRSNNTDGVRDYLFYEKMRREEPKKYFSQDISVQRLKDMDSPDFLKRYQELRSTR